ncbi:MAG: asparagine synthetase B, partial [Rhodocyclaceae bacterium]|nr:asparagine synthetase B [Rhodocyclaceae bacterium]
MAAMMGLLAHRGPDDAGLWEEGEVCLGHQRLAIIDLSPGGHQPMQEGAHVLVYNGEIYNYRELRRELTELGATWRSHSDTEVILKGYRAWGEGLLDKVRGMFALALWDQERRRLWCARDPFGKKPFYYAREGGRLVFASEIEAVVAGLGGRPRLNPEDLAHYLWKGYFPPGRTAYEGIFTLEAGRVLEFTPLKGRLSLRPFSREVFDLGQEGRVSREEALAGLEERLRVAVSRRLVSDVPVGVL